MRSVHPNTCCQDGMFAYSNHGWFNVEFPRLRMLIVKLGNLLIEVTTERRIPRYLAPSTSAWGWSTPRLGCPPMGKLKTKMIPDEDGPQSPLSGQRGSTSVLAFHWWVLRARGRASMCGLRDWGLAGRQPWPSLDFLLA